METSCTKCTMIGLISTSCQSPKSCPNTLGMVMLRPPPSKDLWGCGYRVFSELKADKFKLGVYASISLSFMVIHIEGIIGQSVTCLTDSTLDRKWMCVRACACLSTVSRQ